MNYIGKVYRPPSEAYSFIVQATVGCAHNSCTFCSMYKEDRFAIRPLEDILRDLEEGSRLYPWKKVFLADGDALVMKTKDILTILKYIYDHFPAVEQVTSYATVQDILRKSPEELKSLRKAGLQMLYIGMETGSDKLLEKIKKYVTPKEMVEAFRKVKDAGFKSSVTLISGLGGLELSYEHAIESAKVISQAPPDFLAFLTLYLEPGAPMYEDLLSGRFQYMTPEESLYEIRLFLSHVNAPHTIFRANHASNYLALKGVLNKDSEKMIHEIDEVLSKHAFKPEYLRGL